MGQLAERLGRTSRPFQPLDSLDPLCESFVTPRDEFFVHHHGAIPFVDPEEHRLMLHCDASRSLEFSLEELRDCFPKVTILSTMKCDSRQCQQPAENNWLNARRSAAGTAIWGGVQLLELLLAVEIDHSTRHLLFTGLDEVERGYKRSRFTASIPVEAALRPEILVAYEMNGEPLLPEHGAPLRLVVPGQAGVRSVKWLTEIKLLPCLSDGYLSLEDWSRLR